jgi:hypothetical protein
VKPIFWGAFFVVSGLFLIGKYYFHWNVSTIRVLLGLFLVTLGLSMMFGGGVHHRWRNSNVIMSQARFNITSGNRDYNIVFGQGILDFTQASEEVFDDDMEVNTVFGSSEIKLPRNIAVEIEVNAAFSSIELPDGSVVTFGDQTYLSDPEGKGKPDFTLEINTVFGNTVITH